MGFFSFTKDKVFPILFFILLSFVPNFYLFGSFLEKPFLVFLSKIFFFISFVYIIYIWMMYMKEKKNIELQEELEIAKQKENLLSSKYPEFSSFKDKDKKISELLDKKFPTNSLFKDRLNLLIYGFRTLFLANLERIKDIEEYSSLSESEVSFVNELKSITIENKQILISLDELVKQIILSKDGEDKYSDLISSLSQNIELFKKLKGFVHE